MADRSPPLGHDVLRALFGPHLENKPEDMPLSQWLERMVVPDDYPIHQMQLTKSFKKSVTWLEAPYKPVERVLVTFKKDALIYTRDMGPDDDRLQVEYIDPDEFNMISRVFLIPKKEFASWPAKEV